MTKDEALQCKEIKSYWRKSEMDQPFHFYKWKHEQTNRKSTPALPFPGNCQSFPYRLLRIDKIPVFLTLVQFLTGFIDFW